MPISSKDAETSRYLRVLLMGGPKTGKTYTVITTCPGSVYVINSDDKFSLTPAAKAASPFEFDMALGEGWNGIESPLRAAEKGVQEGRYQFVVWDTISKYAARVEDAFAKATENGKGEPDGRRYWPLYRKHLHAIVGRLFKLDAHVIVNAHYIDVAGAAIDNQLEKTGAGIVPLLGGQCRATIPAEFQDVIFLEKKPTGQRIFVLSSDGVWGPGCRSNLPGISHIDADVSVLMKTFGIEHTKTTKSATKTQTQARK